MNEQKYLSIGYEFCDFGPSDCEGCKQVKPVYFGDASYWDSREGHYYCAECLDKRIDENRIALVEHALQHIREARGVPARLGMRVAYYGASYAKPCPRLGTIVGAHSGYVLIRLDGDEVEGTFHPTWKLDYLDESGAVIYSSKN